MSAATAPLTPGAVEGDVQDSRVVPESVATSCAPSAAPGSLAFAIQRFHERNPEFVAVVECVRSTERVTPVAPPDPYQRFATKVGVPVETYRAHHEAGERWCTWHKDFHDPKAVRYSGLASMCVEGWRLYQRQRRAG